MIKFKNHKAVLSGLTLGMALSLTVGVANAAPIKYALNNVELNDGTYLTGSFSADSSTGYITNVNIVTTDGHTINNTAVSGYDYTATSNIVTNVSGNLIEGATTIAFTTNSYDDEVSLTFQSPLGGSGTDKILGGFVCTGLSYCGSEPTSYTRVINSDNSGAATVPEPAPIALLGVGLLGLMAARRRRSL